MTLFAIIIIRSVPMNDLIGNVTDPGRSDIDAQNGNVFGPQ
jgi:hypothetical protein